MEKIELTNKTWYYYYKHKLNNESSLNNFIIKYDKFLKIIIEYLNIYPEAILIEEGCGIGGISKALNVLGYYPKIIMRDNNMAMLLLCELNNIKNVIEYQNIDIRNFKEYKEKCIVVTHGVLEHFDSPDITQILNTYENPNIMVNIHYVPTIKYDYKSFGDERLLSIKFWKNITKGVIIKDNEDKDIYIIKQNK